MWTIAADILDEAKRQQIFALSLPRQIAQTIRQDVERKYGGSRREWPLWDQENDDPSIQEENAWELVAEFIGDAPCVILWEPRTESQLIEFLSGQDLVRVLRECHRTEFYITDRDSSYLLCFNHHDFLIGSGRAAPWLLEVSKRGDS